MTPRPPYVFSVGALDEIEQFDAVSILAFADDLSRALYPGNTTDPIGARAYHKAQSLHSFEKDPTKVWGKVSRADTGEIIAVGKWSFSDGTYSSAYDSDKLPHWDGVDVALRDTFFGLLGNNRPKIMGDRPHYYINVLATLPEYQGKGAISPIIRHILSEAASKKVPVYIEGSAVGVPVYKYFGFVQVDAIHLDLPGGLKADVALMINENPS